MMNAFNTLIFIVLGVVALAVLMTDTYDATVGKGVDIGKQAVFDKAKDVLNNEDENHTLIGQTIIDLGLPYLVENVTFVKCTADNICERIYGPETLCNTTSGSCYQVEA